MLITRSFNKSITAVLFPPAATFAHWALRQRVFTQSTRMMMTIAWVRRWVRVQSCAVIFRQLCVGAAQKHPWDLPVSNVVAGFSPPPPPRSIYGGSDHPPPPPCKPGSRHKCTSSGFFWERQKCTCGRDGKVLRQQAASLEMMQQQQNT